MKLFLTVAFVGVVVGSSVAQSSLQVSSMDSLIRGNSYASGQLTGHIYLKNTSSASKDYYARRAKVGPSPVVDSNYFCWDLCYPTWSSNSMGTVTIPAGGVANDFSCYIYLKAAGLTGRDTIWYTFTNAADANDTLRVGVAWELTETFSLNEAGLKAGMGVRDGRVYVQPQAWMDEVTQVTVADELGREVARWGSTRALFEGVVLPVRGIYTVRFMRGGAVLTAERVCVF